MHFGLLDILTIIGSLGLFIYGMKVMSDGIQKLAGQKLRQVLSAMTSTRVFGVFTGFLTTATIQSSSAITVMVVSFVNAGLLKLKEAIGVIMGANIGTTVTGVLVVFFGFTDFSLEQYLLAIIAIGFPLMFSYNSALKSFSEFIIGFGLLFLGLSFLKHNVPDISELPALYSFIDSINEMGYISHLIFVLIGAFVTMIVQSSSAAMVLTLALSAKGIIGFEDSAAIILGENIGTTITANLAAIIGNVHAKRAARAHFIFNVVGVFWMLLVFPFYIEMIDEVMIMIKGVSPLKSHETETVSWALTVFHFSFNLINTFLLIWFVGAIEQVVIKMVPTRNKIDKEYHLEYINRGLMSTPELSLLEARKEIGKFGELVYRMGGNLTDLLTVKEEKFAAKMIKKIRKYEKVTDRIEVEIADYLLNISGGQLASSTTRRVRSMINIISNLEAMGDLYYTMSKLVERKLENRIWFSPTQRENLLKLLGLLNQMNAKTYENLSNDYNKADLDTINRFVDEFKISIEEIRQKHLEQLEKREYNVNSGLLYTELVSACDKVADHIVSIREAIKGKV